MGSEMCIRDRLGTDQFDAGVQSTVAFNPVDVVLCLDISRSMAWEIGSRTAPEGGGFHKPPLPGSRWSALVDAVQSFLSQAEDQSPSLRVSLVTFGGGVFKNVESPWDATRTRTETNLEFIGAARSKISERMDFVTQHPLGFSTPTKEAIAQSTGVFAAQSDQEVRKIVILLSDGAETTGSVTSATQLAVAEGIRIHTIYFAGTGDQGSMEEIASITGGLALNADNKLELDQAFNQILTLLSVSLVE